MQCQYCQGIATLRSSKEIYGGRDFGLMFICENYPICDTYVGVHKNSNMPLGILSNKELRYWKKMTHAIFDQRWKSNKKRNARSKAYQWLAKKLNISMDDCHIGMFDIEMCKKTIEICKRDLRGLE